MSGGRVFSWCVVMAVVVTVTVAKRVIFNDVARPQQHQLDVDLPDLENGNLQVETLIGRYHTMLNQCSCMPNVYCMTPTDGSGSIDIRIVTGPPAGVTCSYGMVYCCHQEHPHHHTTTASSVTPSCGTRNIINQPITPSSGQSNFGEYPWTALVMTTGNEYVGGGVLIDGTHVLTAAHRVSTFMNNVSGLKVRLGEWNAANDTEPYHYQEFMVSYLEVHHQFNGNNLHNDIAVITLSTTVPLASSPHINAACVKTGTYDFTGHKCWVSGWGKDAFGPSGNYQEIQKAVDVVVMNQTYCQSQLRNTRLGSFFMLDTTSFLCAGGELSKDACTGDGGSPLVCDVNGVYYLAGLVAWGIGCASYGVPGVYVNINAYESWIMQHMH